MPEDAPPALEFRRISKRYPNIQAVREFSLSLRGGETLCLLGPSGCGKTTVLRLAAGLEHLDAGQIFLNGHEVSRRQYSLPPESRRVGLVVQDFALFPHLTLGGNVGFGLRGLPRAERNDRIRRALALVNMAHRVNDLPHNLSGGEQQRIALARALAPAPKILLLDEPFSALDIGLRRELRDQTLHLLKIGASSSLLVTHEPEEAMFMADRIALMRAGQLEQIGSPEDLYFRPKNAFVAGFLGEVNQLPGTVRGQQIETAIGHFPLGDDTAEGEKVIVLVRSEGLTLAPPDDAKPGAVAATVMEARSLGRTTFIHLNLQIGGAPALHLHARVPGFSAPKVGERLVLAADHRRSFVFPASQSGDIKPLPDLQSLEERIPGVPPAPPPDLEENPAGV
ncbi:MAG: ABC transporter ATP-binding protein [Alphaproteobacteria bacterium]|nr:ABC transporter ATP-binding protein [Alphaproteobacteria bacterium]MDA7983347.1 ABC transporter ATP-binding protein [Alphaproteobacteria bacterium]MDA7988305.1 ABC transporter ATP-binding protein [Alphaproteobacteria bacterium]MDA8008530.1 ABC transporter ATP-binding protein [Alphaproteobacteria bacterium]